MLTFPELKKITIFSCLNDANLTWLSQQAADLHLEPGEYLIHEGEPTSFFVVMDGTKILQFGTSLRSHRR
jgi:thioredoxin reductase (NADPH)